MTINNLCRRLEHLVTETHEIYEIIAETNTG